MKLQENLSQQLKFLKSVKLLIRYFLFLMIAFGLLSAIPRKKPAKRKKFARVIFKPRTIALENASSPEMLQFIQGLKKLCIKGGQERILIIGDSHNQCEDFGNSLLSYLADSAGIPVSGRNFVFPYPLARTSHRSNMRFFCQKENWKGCRITSSSDSCSWGICGWVAHSVSDSVEFRWQSGQTCLKQNDDLSLFCPPETADSYSLFVCDSAGKKSELKYSDSKAGFCTRIQKDGNGISLKAIRKSPGASFTLQGIGRWPAGEGLSLGISGTNGARLDHYLQAPDFQKHISVLNPGLVILALGTNDAFVSDFQEDRLRENLGLLVARIRAANPNTAILLLGPPDHCRRKGRSNPATKQVNFVYSQMSEELDLVFWNQQLAMGGEGSVMAWRKKGLATADMIHFTPNGYTLQAKLLGRALAAELK